MITPLLKNCSIRKEGRVLVVDAKGISSVALLGVMIAESGVINNWSGVVINGYVRDIDCLAP